MCVNVVYMRACECLRLGVSKCHNCLYESGMYVVDVININALGSEAALPGMCTNFYWIFLCFQLQSESTGISNTV